MKFEYYYNNVPSKGLCRNNLIYTSLISKDKKTFVQWYNNDTEYHKGQNQIVDPALMNEKWSRELCFLNHMRTWRPELIPEVLNIDLIEKKIYYKIDGVDFWQRQLDNLPVPDDWQDQMIKIIEAHHNLNMYKYSMHPSSYFVVDGQLKSINYFFTYDKTEGPISIADHQSHLSEDRQADLRVKVEALGMDWNKPTDLRALEFLCWESFRTNYPADFVKRVQDTIK